MSNNQINIDKGQRIALSNDTFGSISILLNDTGEFVVVSNGPIVNVEHQKWFSINQPIELTSECFGLSNLNVDGDITISNNITQSNRF